MRRSMLAVYALLAVAAPGCKKIQQAIEARRHPKKPAPATAARPAPDTTKRAAPPPQPARQQPEARPASAVPSVADVPYDSPDTGTVAPGMAERDIYSLWGAPAAVRHSGEFTYLYYHNGCERSCGTMDVVFLQNGQVVDAIVRWSGHGYSGESSSPPGRKPEPTNPVQQPS